MRSGFTYKNRHSSEFGIVAKTKSKPVLPEMKSFTFESPVTDGVYDFSEANEYGRAFYNDRFFEIQLQVCAKNLRALEAKVSKIALWLRGSGELVFDSQPLIKWRARVASELGFVPELKGKATVMTVVFRVEPFGVCVFNTADGPILNSFIGLDENIPIDIPRVFTWSIDGGSDTYEYVSETIRAINAGNVPIRPIVKITGEVRDISIVLGDKMLGIDAVGDGFIIDFKKQTVTDLLGHSVMSHVEGRFFELAEAVQDVELTLYVKGEAGLSIEYEPEFICGCDFSCVDWGESNA